MKKRFSEKLNSHFIVFNVKDAQIREGFANLFNLGDLREKKW